jgi:hypothetical protein
MNKFQFIHPKHGVCLLAMNMAPNNKVVQSDVPNNYSFYTTGDERRDVRTETAYDCGNPVFHVNLLWNLNYYFDGRDASGA